MFLANSRRTALFALQSYDIIQTQKHSTCNCCVGSPSFPFFIFLLLGFFLECKYLEMYPIPLLFININLTSLQIINVVKAVVWPMKYYLRMTIAIVMKSTKLKHSVLISLCKIDRMLPLICNLWQRTNWYGKRKLKCSTPLRKWVVGASKM